MEKSHLEAELTRISEARHHDPHAVLGCHPDVAGVVVRACIPFASEVSIAEGGQQMTRLPGSDIFEWHGDGGTLPAHHSLIWRDDGHREHIARDPYTFAPQIGDLDLHLFGEGRHRHAHRYLGAHEHEVDGIAGVLFAVWCQCGAGKRGRRLQSLGRPTPSNASARRQRRLGAFHP